MLWTLFLGQSAHWREKHNHSQLLFILTGLLSCLSLTSPVPPLLLLFCKLQDRFTCTRLVHHLIEKLSVLFDQSLHIRDRSFTAKKILESLAISSKSTPYLGSEAQPSTRTRASTFACRF